MSKIQSNIQSDPFWYNDLTILLNSKRITEFFPNKKLSLNENLNALTRLGIYMSLIMIFYTKNIRWINIAVFMLLFTYYLYSTKTDILKPMFKVETFESELESEPEKISTTNIPNELYAELPTPEPLQKVKCTVPTIDNPFMNMTMKDYLNYDENGNIIQREEACDTSDIDIKKDIDDKFKNNLYKDVNDLFGKFNSQRQFYTMPWTSIIPDINGDFKNWLYKSPKSCKENQDYCLLYEDIRAKRPVT